MLKQQWQLFLLAVGFFTRVPVPPHPNFKESDLNQAARYFPLVGLLVGLMATLSWWLLSLGLPPALAILGSMATTILLTGAFHEDGLADSADGLGGGLDRARKLEIMQDSRLGSYGAIALVGILLAKFHALSSLSAALLPFAWLCGHALSRLAAVLIMATSQYVRFQGKSKPLATQLTRLDLQVALATGLACWLLFVVFLLLHHPLKGAVAFVLCTGLPVVTVWLLWRRTLLKQLQGYTGDTLGATQQLTELAFYLGLIVWERML